jgi:hypothetical protein
MKRWLHIFLLVFLAGCQTAKAIPTGTKTVSATTRPPTKAHTATFTPSPTLTSLPTFTPTLKACPQIDANLIYVPPEGRDYELSIQNFLNAGGDPKLLAQHNIVTIEELNADDVPEILVQPYTIFKSLLLFSCSDGEYREQLFRDDNSDIGLAEHIVILAIDDLNQNGVPEVVFKTITCLWGRCGSLFIVEWDGEKFARLTKDESWDEIVDYAEMDDPKDVYLKDLDNDGIPELVWIGELPPEGHGDYWDYYPLRLATHVYKWDGNNYSALPVSYSAPEFRFQAIQDGDRATLASDYEKAVGFYELAISSNSLDWWVEERRLYNLSQHGFTTCDGSPCPSPNPNPKERPILSAYARFRIMLIHVLTNDLGEAEKNYRQLLLDFPSDNAGYPIAEMATLFWDEYLTSKDVSKACGVSINFIGNQRDVLILLRGNTTSQNIHYDRNPNEVCPFQQ